MPLRGDQSARDWAATGPEDNTPSIWRTGRGGTSGSESLAALSFVSPGQEPG